MNNTSKLIVGNWKMNTTLPEGSLLLSRIIKELTNFTYPELVICPPSTHLYAFSKELEKSKGPLNIELGAQNISEHEEGPYTGEISATMLHNIAKYVIVGHSERRKFFNESDAVDGKKLQTAIRHRLTPILCVGEDQQERSDGHAKQKVLDQLNTDLAHVTSQEIKDVIVAYEPVWSIGTGNFAKPAQVEEMVWLIHNNLIEQFGKMAGSKVRVLYGGSVDGENARNYLNIKGVDGLLVGGASLNYKQFAKIVRASA
jgi:triosephosphate isomerase